MRKMSLSDLSFRQIVGNGKAEEKEKAVFGRVSKIRVDKKDRLWMETNLSIDKRSGF